MTPFFSWPLVMTVFISGGAYVSLARRRGRRGKRTLGKHALDEIVHVAEHDAVSFLASLVVHVLDLHALQNGVADGLGPLVEDVAERPARNVCLGRHDALALIRL